MSEPESKKVFIKNFGCQMNDYDGERMRELLVKEGYRTTDAAEEADLIVLNTCSVREKAEAKVSSEAGKFRTLKKANPNLRLAIAGCVAQQEGAALLKRIPLADLTFGPDQIPNLPTLLSSQKNARRRMAITEVTEVEDYHFLDADPTPGNTKIAQLVTIQKGCDNDCAFCIVPSTRGREVSRPGDEVVREVMRFVAAGAREVTLIGQNVNSYHGIGSPDGDDFAALLARVDNVAGLLRTRFTTSHPKDFTPKVAEAYRDLPTLAPYLHLPVQSGSSRTLKRMCRKYTRAEYLEKIDYVKSLVPDISLSTDIIVGYPGESDADFAETLSLIERVQYDSIYSFCYSPRPNTPALKLQQRDDVPAAVKDARLQQLQALQNAITQKRLARWVGRTTPVLVEGVSKNGDDKLCGRTPGNEVVNFAAPPRIAIERLVGALVPVAITSSGRFTLKGDCALPSPVGLPVVA